jgi:hypothetical protein
MHSSEYPSSVEATDYEPMPGQKAINIYVSGSSGKDAFIIGSSWRGQKKAAIPLGACCVATDRFRRRTCVGRCNDLLATAT